MRILLILLLCPVMLVGQSDFSTLTTYMQGSFSSAAQARSDTDYFDIELEMVRIWPEQADGVWLYIEQAVASKKDKPYRQRIYHVQEQDDNTFTSTMYRINNGEDWFGTYKEPARFYKLSMDSISLIPGCAITMTPEGDHFVGSTNEKDCTNAWGKATYATSEVEVYNDRLISWDRGWNDEDAQVWGAEKGGYVFMKRTNSGLSTDQDPMSKRDLSKVILDEKESGVVAVTLTVGADGTVSDVRYKEEVTFSDYLKGRVADEVKKLQFESSEEGMEVDFRFIFKTVK